MINIFVYVQSTDGCSLHRLLNPYKEIEKITDELKVEFKIPDEIKTKEDLYEYLSNFDAFIFHRIIPQDLFLGLRKYCSNLKLIVDIDDFWHLGSKHILEGIYKTFKIGDMIQNIVEQCDYVTTTTPILRDKIKPFNKNVVIFPNALNKEENKPINNPSNRIRFGLIGGSTHVSDMELLNGIANQLPNNILDKIQFVCCGFDRGFYTYKDEHGNTQQKPMDWDDVGWTKIEKIFTDNYKTISTEHKNLLKQYLYKQDYQPFDEPYRRIWAKDIWHYMDSFDEIDVLLVPLIDNEFNRNKSELKMVEASVKEKPCIVSDVYPYKYCAINAIEKGGSINPEGNCLMVTENKKTKGWVKAIERLVNNPELLEQLRHNISKLTDEKYNLRKITEKRIEFLKDITGK